MKSIALSESDLLKVRAATSIIEKKLDRHYTIPDLATMVCMNTNKLKEGFKQLHGVGPYAYLLNKRIEMAKSMLLEDASIRSIALVVGFTGSNAETNFIKSFKKVVKQSPAAWRKQAIQPFQREQTV